METRKGTAAQVREYVARYVDKWKDQELERYAGSTKDIRRSAYADTIAKQGSNWQDPGGPVYRVTFEAPAILVALDRAARAEIKARHLDPGRLRFPTKKANGNGKPLPRDLFRAEEAAAGPDPATWTDHYLMERVMETIAPYRGPVDPALARAIRAEYGRRHPESHGTPAKPAGAAPQRGEEGFNLAAHREQSRKERAAEKACDAAGHASRVSAGPSWNRAAAWAQARGAPAIRDAIGVIGENLAEIEFAAGALRAEWAERDARKAAKPAKAAKRAAGPARLTGEAFKAKMRAGREAKRAAGPRLAPGYAYRSASRNPREPETVIVPEEAIEGASFVGTATIDGYKCNAWKHGKNYFFQTARG